MLESKKEKHQKQKIAILKGSILHHQTISFGFLLQNCPFQKPFHICHLFGQKKMEKHDTRWEVNITSPPANSRTSSGNRKLSTSTFQKNLKIFRRSQVRPTSGQRSRPSPFALSATETEIIIVATQNFAKRLPEDEEDSLYAWILY